MAKKITWYQTAQYIALLLVAVALPVSWRYALWAAVLLVAMSVVNIAVSRRLSIVPLRGTAVGPFLIVLYWLVLLATMLYSHDAVAGWEVLWRKAVLLIFPLGFMLTDNRWLDMRRMRGVAYAFLVSQVGVFAYYTVVAVGKVSSGGTVASAFGTAFNPDHHAYIALYVTVALAFVYHELHTHWGELPVWKRVLMIATVPMLIFYVVIVNSRAGMLSLYFLIVVCPLHFALTRRRWWQALLIMALLGGFTFGVEKTLPGHQPRVAQTIEDVAGDAPTDARVKIYGSGVSAALERPVFGYGVGDYRRHLTQQYADDAFDSGVSSHYNAHNQYVESMLAAGVLGLSTLVAMLLWPLHMAWRRRSKALCLIFLLTCVIAFNLLCESMLERQMGLLFIGPILVIMSLVVRQEEKKFC